MENGSKLDKSLRNTCTVKTQYQGMAKPQNETRHKVNIKLQQEDLR